MVTVIINTYNEDPDVLKRAIDSYRNQTYKGIQIIIATVEGDPCIGRMDEFDDCDFSVLPISDHPGKSPAGAYAQINYALRLISAGSLFLCYASGNDYANKDKISREVSMCLTHQKKVCYSAFTKVRPDGSKIADALFYQYDYDKHCAVGNFVSDCSLISMDLVRKYLPYRTEFSNFAHWDSWLRMYEGEGNVFIYNHITTWNYVQNEADMHNVRNSDPAKRAEYFKSQKEFIKNRLK